MRATTKVWLVGITVGWALLAYGWSTGHKWALAAATVVLCLFAIERADNWARERRGGDR